MRLLKGRSLEIASGLSELPSAQVEAYRKHFAEIGFSLPELHHNSRRKVNRKSSASRKRGCSTGKARSRELVGTALAKRIEGLLSIKGTSTCNCKALAAEMNAWGIAGCELNRDKIVDSLVSNREILVASIRDWLGHAAGLAAAFIPEVMLRSGAGWLLDKAIEDTRNAIPPRKPRPQRPQQGRKNRHHYTGWRSEADGPRIEHGPFVSSVRHLTYHIYAVKKHDSWKWNLEQLAKRWNLFNGQRIVGISHDENSQSPDAVLRFADTLGIIFDHQVIRPNIERLREVVTFLPMLQILDPPNAKADEVVFSAHAKGQKYDDPGHTRDWTDLMYQTCLDDWPAVYNALRTSVMAGSFKEYGLLGKNSNWAFSGSFHWWRLAEIGKRKWHDIDQWFAGTESWPSKVCDPRETACLFLNDSKRMYDHQYWVDVVWPEWHKYQEARKRGG